MAEQIYSEVFYANRNTFYENECDARKKALMDANEFFINHDSFCIMNVIENWNENRSHLGLVVYYKGYI